MWHDVNKEPIPNRLVLVYHPSEQRRGRIVLGEYVMISKGPPAHPRKPTHWASIPELPKVPPADYDAK
jgi:hypothetical protein